MRVLIQSRLHDYESVILKSRRKDNVYGLAVDSMMKSLNILVTGF